MKKYIAIIITFILIFWISSIIKCEIYTIKHGYEFSSFEEINTSSKYKILEYRTDFAKIYCVNYNKTNGSIHSFIKKDGTWTYNKWEDGGWSKTGNADGVIWPYFR